jgi:subtilisin family serine protease
MKRTTDTPTFERPSRLHENVPGRLLVRFDADALAKAAAPPPGSSVEMRIERLPASVSEPLTYLRRNAGLRSVDPVFGTVRRTNRGPAQRDALATIASVSDVDEIGAGVAVLDLPEAKITKSLLKRVNGSPAVEIAEPLPARWLYAASTDPQQNLQWGLPAIEYFRASRPSAGKVLVGILDTGIDTSHPDLPDPVIYQHAGYGSRDSVGHGTHVAGIIGALTNNDVGISGVCDCEIASWKVFPDDPKDPYLDSTAYIRALGEVAGAGVNVVNLSLGGSAHSQIEADLFARAIAEGVTFVAAMGNEYEERNPISYPAAYDDVISVGAIDETRARASFSNTGKHIDVSAPGVNILSTLPTTKSVQRSETDYAAWSGTSMATPFVSAAAALLIAHKPGRSPAQIAARLQKTASPVPEMSRAKWTEAHGYGLINLRAALR